MSLTWPQLYQHRPGRKISRSSATEEKVREESRFLCHRYLSRKMRRSGMAIGSANLANMKSFNHRTDEHATLVICQMIETMETLYPETFNNVATNMHVSSFNERLLCQDFSRFVKALFINGIKWPLILAYFAFCGGLAEECVRHGNARLIASVMNWSDCYVSIHLATWIKEQGGWVSTLYLCIELNFDQFVCNQDIHTLFYKNEVSKNIKAQNRWNLRIVQG